MKGVRRKVSPCGKKKGLFAKSVCSTGFQGRNHWVGGGGDLTHRCQAGPGFLPLVSSDSSLLCSRSQPLSSLGGTWGVGWGLCPAAFFSYSQHLNVQELAHVCVPSPDLTHGHTGMSSGHFLPALEQGAACTQPPSRLQARSDHLTAGWGRVQGTVHCQDCSFRLHRSSGWA